MATKQITTDAALVAAEELLLAFARSDDARATIMAAFPDEARMPGTCRPVYRAMLALQDKGKPINTETVAAASGVEVKEVLVLALDDGTPRKPDEIDAAIGIVDAFAKQQETEALSREFPNLIKEHGAQKALDLMQDRAAAIASTGGKERPTDGKTVLDALWADITAQDNGDQLLSGLEPFDEVTLGLRPGDGVVLSGRYKGRKSTAMRNLVLAYAARGIGVSVALLEGSQKAFMAELQAMVANLVLISEGHPDRAHLFGRRILATKRWDQDHYKALTTARGLMGPLASRLFIYDVKDGVKVPTVLTRKFKRDAMLRESRIGFVDYGGLMNFNHTSDRELSERAGDWLTEMPDQLDMALVMLWQLNESTIRGDSGDSAGLMGGTGVAAAADFVFRTNYDDKDNPNSLELLVKASRHSGGGDKKKVEINKYCGSMTRYQKWDAKVRGTVRTELKVLPSLSIDQPILLDKIA